MPAIGMIPTLSDFESTAKSAIDNSKKQQEEAAAKDTSKPALAKKMVSTYGKYVFLGMSAIGIIYKMFFVDIDQPKRRIDSKKDIPISQQRVEKKGKTRIESDSVVPKNMISGSSSMDFKSMTSVSIPPVPSLNLPTVPSFSAMDPVESPPTPSAVLLPPPPVVIPNIEKPEIDNAKNNGKNAGKQAPAQQLNPQVAKAEYDMFLVKTANINQVKSKQKNISRSTSGPKDFIVFDGSGLSLRTGNIEDKISSTQVTNLANTIATGKIVEAVLETAIDSENQGPIRAIISRDVYGESGENILVPRGSRAYGTYSTQITPGQSRVAIMFSRILRPDGVSISISADAGDQIGRSGIAGDVDSRYFEMLQNSLLLSFLTLGTAVITEKVLGLNGQSQVVNNNGSVATTNITPGNAAAQSMINTASNIANTMATNLASKIQPVISVPHGYLILLTVNKDMVIPKYKAPGGSNRS